MVEFIQLLMPLLGVVIGAVLSGIGLVYKTHIERKRAIASALSDLLEVRHHVCGIDIVLKEFNKRFNLPVEVNSLLVEMIEETFPLNQDTHQRYENTVTLLASIDPLLAFNLRSKNSLPTVLESIRRVGESTSVDITLMAQYENTLRNILIPSINEAVLTLAKKHSFTTNRRVKKLVSRSEECPPQLNLLFEQIEVLGITRGRSATNT